MLNTIRLLLGLTTYEKDDLLTALIDQATQEAVIFTRNDDVTALESCICQMVVYNYNRLGTEGLNSENYSGVSYGYSTDYPEAIIRQLKAKRKLQVF